ncbi:MAG: hypothetical protein Q9191_000712 [Dirinaria sp. TL-2023a]
MSTISIPRTPSPKSPSTAAPKASSLTDERTLTSPPSQPTSELTPPPSSQVRKSIGKAPQSTHKLNNALASPPATLKMTPSIKSSGLFGEVPTVESAQDLNEEQLRGLVSELLPALTEARMSAAHSRLQHHLLTIETAEYTKRAEVEHDLTRREVQVLQEGQGARGVSASPRSPQSPSRRHLDLALKRCNELQTQNALLEQRLTKAKKAITKLDGKNFELAEEAQRLRQRIKHNREHLNAMRSSGTISIVGTPSIEYRTPLHRTPRTPATARTPHTVNTVGSQNAKFDALVIAGEVMSGEANSVPSTPTRPSAKKLHHNHNRGAHSLSSLPSTPNRSRPLTSQSNYATPVEPATRGNHLSVPDSQLLYEEEEEHRSSRDSTISASENEDETFDDYSVPASSASQKAADMLRRDARGASDRYGKSAGLKQGKIVGHVTKPYYDRSSSTQKRSADDPYDEGSRSMKRAKPDKSSHERIGLGIRS